jgi:apolipoprotein D and lipocalin family protein
MLQGRLRLKGIEMKLRLAATSIGLAAAIMGCTGVPKGLEPVSGFDAERYLGKWYEIARLDHSFERNLSNVSATYARGNDGTISVVNRGFDEKAGEWKQVTGRARFIGDKSVGSLKVSFFGPFYGGYHVIELDKAGYSYAMVAGPNRSYLWILSRSTALDGPVLTDLKTKAAQWGFDTAELISVRHDRPDE